MQRGDGFAGALIIKPKNDRHAKLYDYDLFKNAVVIQDWYDNIAANKGPLHLNARLNNRPDSLIING